MTEHERQTARLREWIEARAGTVDEDTPLLEERRIDSLQLVELVLFIEELTGTRVQPERLVPGSFHSIRRICECFLNTAATQEDRHA